MKATAPSAKTLRLLRLITGAVFVPAGAIKFLAFGWETDQFERFGLPIPEAWVLAAGVIELVGAYLLLRNRLVVLAAVMLGTTMVVAIAVSGVKEGDVVPSLTVAPALLAACVVLVVDGRRTRSGGRSPAARR